LGSAESDSKPIMRGVSTMNAPGNAGVTRKWERSSFSAGEPS
jgi:hypothetical protein